MSATLFAAGIFAHETGQRLLHILLRLSDRGFRGLYEKCANDLRGTYYQTGLRRVPLWSDGVLLEDIAHVTQECPDIAETFEACFHQYIADRFRAARSSHRCPTLLEFTRRFFESIGQHDAMASGEYFQRGDPVTTRVACMDAARQALYAVVTSENVRIELASEVGSVARGAARSVAPPRRPEEVVGPWDSISQVGSSVPAADPPRTPPAEPPPSVPPAKAPPRARQRQAPPRPPPPPPAEEEEEEHLAAEEDVGAEEGFRSREHRQMRPVTPPRSEARSEARSEPPPRRSVARSRGFPVTPVQVAETSSVVSRHDFEPEPAAEDVEDMVFVPESISVVAPPAPRSHAPVRQTASSRDSSVSVGLRTIKSPRAA